mgnify:CR=1 FL=1
MRILRDIGFSQAPLAVMCAIGVIWGAVAAMLPDIKTRIGLNDVAFGTILLTAGGGAMLAMALAPRIQAVAPRGGLIIAAIGMAVSIAPLGLADTVMTFTIVMVALGVMTGLADILANAHVAELEAHHERSLMNLNHGGYSIVYAVTAILTGAAREAAVPPEIWFLMVGGAVAFLCGFTRVRPIPPAIDQTPVIPPRPMGGPIILIGCVVLIGFFAEHAAEGWSALHIERTLGGGATEGALGPAMLGLTMGIGRMCSHFLSVRGREAQILATGAMVAGAGLIMAALAPAPIFAYFGFGLFGLGVSVIAPLALAMAGQMAPQHSGRAPFPMLR